MKAESPQSAWIIVADRANMELCARHGVFGLNSKGVLTKMKPGGALIGYIRGEKVFAAIGKVTRPHYLDDERIFEGGLYPERVGVELRIYPPERSVDVWSIIDELTFASNKMNWWASLAGGIRQIPMADYDRVAHALAGTAGAKGAPAR